MGECTVEYELEEDIPISIVEDVVLISLFISLLILLSVSFEDFVENNINLLLFSTYLYGMNISLMIIKGMEKVGNLTCIYCYLQ